VQRNKEDAYGDGNGHTRATDFEVNIGSTMAADCRASSNAELCDNKFVVLGIIAGNTCHDIAEISAAIVVMEAQHCVAPLMLESGVTSGSGSSKHGECRDLVKQVSRVPEARL
jgi:hypothetical protein